jgi:hypothetical protein
MPRISKKALAAQAKRKAAAAQGWATRRGEAPCKPTVAVPKEALAREAHAPAPPLGDSHGRVTPERVAADLKDADIFKPKPKFAVGATVRHLHGYAGVIGTVLGWDAGGMSCVDWGGHGTRWAHVNDLALVQPATDHAGDVLSVVAHCPEPGTPALLRSRSTVEPNYDAGFVIIRAQLDKLGHIMDWPWIVQTLLAKDYLEL